LTLAHAVYSTRAMTAGTPSRFGSHQGGRSVGKKKVRHHVNPLKSTHQGLIELPERWPEAFFAEPQNPMHVDIGCARGLFCLEAAESQPSRNYLGLEIRSVLAEAARDDAAAASLRNAAFLACNANVNFDELMQRAEPHTLHSVSIQFPDPWFKARHKKRRVVQPALVASIARHLPPGGWLFVQTDVLELAEDARDTICAEAGRLLVDERAEPDAWDVPKPVELGGITTERERSCFELGRPVYRRVFTKQG
jgi:tRNA (guanine-N7-)-methyltransferase